MAKSEHRIQQEIEVALSKKGCRVFRTNVGKVKTIDGRWFNTGLPKGHPDLYGFRCSDGKIFYVEVKSATGKPRKEQVQFHQMLMKWNIPHGIARSVEDALKIADGAVGYGFKD